MSLRRFYRKITPGFTVIDTKEWIDRNIIEIYLKNDSKEPKLCFRCGYQLDNAKVGESRLKIRTMDIHGFKTFYILKRQKHHCFQCKKVRS